MGLDILKDEEFLKKTLDRKTGKSLHDLYLEQRSAEAKAKSANNSKANQKKKKIVDLSRSRTLSERREQKEIIKLTLPMPPAINHIYATNKAGKRVLTEEAKKYKKTVFYLAKEQGAVILTGELVFTMRVFRARKSGDSGNRLKLIEDALKNVCYEDDEQLADHHIFRRLDRENPRIELIIRQKRI